MRTVTLGSVTQKVATWNPKTSRSAQFTYVDLSAVDNVSKRITTPATIRCDEAPSRARQLLREGDVLVSTVRPNLNAAAAVFAEHDGSTASTGFTVLRPSPEVNSRYLLHWVTSPSFVGDMIQKATGASYPAVSDGIVKASHIPLPAIDEQRRIAAILDQADAIRTRRRQILTHLDALPGTLVRGFVATSELRYKPLSEWIDPDDRLNYGVVQPGPDVHIGVPLVRVTDLRYGRINRQAVKRISLDIERHFARSRLKGTEILVSSVGTIGRIAVAESEDIGSNIPRAITRVPVSSPPVRSYLAAYLSSPPAQRYMKSKVRTVAQPTLNVSDLAGLPVPDLSIQTIRSLSDTLHVVTGTAAELHRVARRDDELFASLQARAFRGEL